MRYTKNYLEELVNNSKCMWDVIEQIPNIKRQEGNYRYIKNLILKCGIDISHFENQRLNIKKPRLSLENFLINGKNNNGNNLKDKLYRSELKQPICEKCGQGEIWNGEKISLILDHIDGDRYNNLLENLRIVCPNCNATLGTHCGKNRIIKNKSIKNSKITKQEFIDIVNNSLIDFTKRGWIVKLGKLIGLKPMDIKYRIDNWYPELVRYNQTQINNNELIHIVLNSNINWGKCGWSKQLGVILNLERSACLKWIKKYLPNIYEKCWKK